MTIELPELPYAIDALEPHISKETLEYHYGKHHQAYVTNLNAALDIGGMRLALNGVAKGLLQPGAYFEGFKPSDDRMGSHRNLGERHVSILDDHDNVFGAKIRFSSESASDHQVAAGVAMIAASHRKDAYK